MRRSTNMINPASTNTHAAYFRPGQDANAPRESILRASSSARIMRPETAGSANKAGAASGLHECQTCKNRKYQDGSNDPGVSFKSASHVAPEAAASAVASHEGEHVSREKTKAGNEGREVVYQSVKYSSATCPECGKVYISGGETTTVTRSKPQRPETGKGQSVDAWA